LKASSSIRIVVYSAVFAIGLGFAQSEDRESAGVWWAFAPLPEGGHVPPTDGPGNKWARNPIDQFVWNRLGDSGLKPSAEAKPRVLARRLHFNLTGLPPHPDRLDKITAAPSEESYLELVDELLSSPSYGERWARHWLDVARYGESNGFEYNQPRRNAWPYRDWVIEALNGDMPYDEFARAQIAGSPEAVGFLVAGVYRTLAGSNDVLKPPERHEALEEMVGTLSQAFLGITAQCARCHDHPTDPIPTADYYRLAAAISGVHHPAEKDKSEVYSVVSKTPGKMHVFKRGDTSQPGEEITAGGLTTLGIGAGDFGLGSESGDAERRRELAEWITNPNNHLFARTIVNRVWHYHFGTGIVDTPSDLGRGGGAPSHPGLLDWLATWFRDNGYSLKALHRLIVSSSTYRQSAGFRERAAAIDREARLLWRFPPRRLEGEVVRDSILAVAGVLNPERGGPGFVDTEEKNFNSARYYLPIDAEGPEFRRRTIYRFSPRGGRSALLDTFDCPDASATAPRRHVTTTPVQALALKNNTFVWRMADHFAKRLEREAGTETVERVQSAWRLALGRLPTSAERDSGVAFANEHGLPALGRALFNSGEFVLID